MTTLYFVLYSCPPNINVVYGNLGHFPTIDAANTAAHCAATRCAYRLRTEAHLKGDKNAEDITHKYWYDKGGMVHLESTLPCSDHRYRMTWVERDDDFQKRMERVTKYGGQLNGGKPCRYLQDSVDPLDKSGLRWTEARIATRITEEDAMKTWRKR